MKEKAVFKLSFKNKEQPADKNIDQISFSYPLLNKSIHLYCRVRWCVVLILFMYGLSGFYPDGLEYFYLKNPGIWPFIAALFLTVFNAAILFAAKRHALDEKKWIRARHNLLTQIIVDLLVLSVVIHFVGVTGSYAVFAFLFHIALSCIFFSSKTSLEITVFSLFLYGILLSIAVGETSISPPISSGIFISDPLTAAMPEHREIIYINSIFVVAIFFILWYLTSFLSRLVQKRNEKLYFLTKQLKSLQKEKDEYMLRTTHELKAPLAAIGSNVQLLTKGYCGDLSKEALTVLGKIDARCKSLGRNILEMLQLFNIRYFDRQNQVFEEVDLKEELKWNLNRFKKLSEEKKITVEADLNSAVIKGVREQIRILFSNFLSNALNYSYPGGKVKIRCYVEEPRPVGPTSTVKKHGDASEESTAQPPGCVVVFEDHGIGIPAEKISKIFNEYYRTDEAARFNRSSSGLGLAIAKRIAETHNIDIIVETVESEGSKFTLHFNKSQ